MSGHSRSSNCTHGDSIRHAFHKRSTITNRKDARYRALIHGAVGLDVTLIGQLQRQLVRKRSIDFGFWLVSLERIHESAMSLEEIPDRMICK